MLMTSNTPFAGLRLRRWRDTLLTCAACLGLLASPLAPGQTVQDAIEIVRGAVGRDRQALVAESMNLTEAESGPFWSVYREYRSEVEKIGDGLVKLVLEYSDVYPDQLDEKRAAAMLKEYTRLEERWTALKSRYSRKLLKTLPASKVLRFLQVENRLDIVVRMQLASAIPLVPNASGAKQPSP